MSEDTQVKQEAPARIYIDKDSPAPDSRYGWFWTTEPTGRNGTDVKYVRADLVSAPIVAPVVDDTVLVDREAAAKIAFDSVKTALESGNHYSTLQVAAIAAANVRKAAPASTVAPQQSDLYDADGYCRECASVGNEFYAGYVEQRRTDHAKLHAPASPAALSLENCMAEPKFDTEPICANCEREIVKSEHGPPINDICWSHVHNGVVWCNWPAPAALRGEAAKCIHCDPSFVPTGPDDWCYCACHRDGEF